MTRLIPAPRSDSAYLAKKRKRTTALLKREVAGKRSVPTVHESLPEATSLTIELPDPPSVNHIWKRKKSGGVYLSPEYKAWRTQAGMALISQRALKAVRGPVIIQVTFPDRGRRDLDNLQKAISDLLVHHGIIQEDKREIVREVHLGWGDVESAIVEIRKAYDWIQRRDFALRQKERAA